MPIDPALKKKMQQAQGTTAAEDEEESEELNDEGESPSDVDAPEMKSGKMNPLMLWATKKKGP